MAVFKVRVPTLDKEGHFYKDSDGDVNPCEEGVIFVMAKGPVEVAQHVPDLLSIKRVGLGIYLAEREEEPAEPEEDISQLDEEMMMARFVL